MINQKLDAELSLSLALSEEERRKSPVLQSGYEPGTKQWRLILLYQGSLDEIQTKLSVTIIPLLGNYAIITIPVGEIDTLLTFPQVLYLELPRPLYQEEITGIAASCLSAQPYSPETFPRNNLTGKGVIAGILDSGIDFRHPDFMDFSGKSRILTYWDQSLPYDGNNRYGLGYIFSQEELNAFLENKNTEGNVPEPSRDSGGHGTHIAGICAGNGRASAGKNHGVAPEAALLVVKLKNEGESVFTDYANLMMAVDYAVNFSREKNSPLALNISYGSNDGPHDGSGLMERYLANCIFYGKNTVTIATGNEGLSRRHSAFHLKDKETKEIFFSVAPGETSLYVQLWKSYADKFSYTLSLPGGETQISIPGFSGIFRFTLEENEIRLVISEPTPYQSRQEMFLVILPADSQTTIRPGVWRLSVIAEVSVDGHVRLWLPSREATNTATGFLDPTINWTLTIPSTANNVISVSGYDSTTDVFAPFSGRGFSDQRETKPDLTAPAVNILSTAPGGGYSIRTGTSMAAPFVTGACALLMQYGIVDQRDPFLYGEKVKAMLQKGARPLPAFSEYPNEDVGWGALCVRESLL